MVDAHEHIVVRVIVGGGHSGTRADVDRADANSVVDVWLVQQGPLNIRVVDSLARYVGNNRESLVTHPASGYMIPDNIVNVAGSHLEANRASVGSGGCVGIVAVTGQIANDDIVRRDKDLFASLVRTADHDAPAWRGLSRNR